MAEVTKPLKDLASITPSISPSYEQIVKPAQEKLAESTKAKAEVAGAEKAMLTQAEADRQKTYQQSGETAAQAVKTSPVFTEKEEVYKKTSEPFIPTKDDVKDIAALYSLVNVVGMAMGAGGKQNSMQAMHAMNGMLEGYQKGRQDLYKKEKDKFDVNMKNLKSRYDMLDKQLKDVMTLAQTDREASRQAADVLFAQTGANFYKQMADKIGLAGLYEYHKQAYDAANKLFSEKNRLEAQAEQRSYRERSLAMQERRLQMSEDKARGGGKDGKPLKESELSKIEGLQSLSTDLQKLKSEFKDEYASLGLLGFGADLSYEAKRRLGDEEGRKAVQWWSKYERLQAPNRHALFGATLTGNELKNYQSFTAKKSDDPSVVRDMVQDQIDYTKGTADNRKFAYESAGYKVPEIAKPRSFVDTYGGGVTPQSAEKSTGKYSINQVLEIKGKKYRVTGLSNPDDPDVEEVK